MSACPRSQDVATHRYAEKLRTNRLLSIVILYSVCDKQQFSRDYVVLGARNSGGREDLGISGTQGLCRFLLER